MPVENYSKLIQDGSAPAGVDIIGDWQTYYGGPSQLWVWGDLGGGEVHMEATLNEVAIVCISNTFISDATNEVASITTFNLNHGTRIRAVLIKTLSESSGVVVRVN